MYNGEPGGTGRLAACHPMVIGRRADQLRTLAEYGREPVVRLRALIDALALPAGRRDLVPGTVDDHVHHEVFDTRRGQRQPTAVVEHDRPDSCHDREPPLA